jgi:hypothetical protein
MEFLHFQSHGVGRRTLDTLFLASYRLDPCQPRTEEAAEKRVIFLVLSTLCFSFLFLMEVSDGLVGVYLTVSGVVAGSRHTST